RRARVSVRARRLPAPVPARRPRRDLADPEAQRGDRRLRGRKPGPDLDGRASVVKPAAVARAERLLGSPAEAWTAVGNRIGNPDGRWRVVLADGRSAFVK